MSGVFITFEGGDGSGKTTQIVRLASALRAVGCEPVIIREPGGTVVGEGVREILLDPRHEGLNPIAETLLFAASRAQLSATVIRPALEEGRVVICDRYADSTVAYQGYGRGLDLETVRAVNTWATTGLVPDCTLLLDVDPAEGILAATPAEADRLEREAITFHERIRAGYLEMAHAEPERWTVIPRDRADVVWEKVHAAIRPVLERAGVSLDSR
ncbi:MAG: dTMP kinase [Actinobacteria bacterium HGW-Actinobacteria-6]|nr:MAG: dTMP kinase [Actinobacteria bacterium HGW-Actinobacteria-6]